MTMDPDWFEYQLEKLRQRCEELEKENFELRRCIRVAVNTLEKDNENTRNYLEKEEKKIVLFEPNFQKPKWEAK